MNTEIFFLCPLSAGAKGVHHHVQLIVKDIKFVGNYQPSLMWSPHLGPMAYFIMVVSFWKQEAMV